MRLVHYLATAVMLLGMHPSAARAQAGGTRDVGAPTGAAQPKITFTDVPPNDCGGPSRMESIAGKITGLPAGQYRLTIYAQACNGSFYVQPTIANPVTPLSADGTFDAYVHLGHTYYVLVTKPGYQPSAELTAAPEKGGNVVAVFTVRGKKNN